MTIRIVPTWPNGVGLAEFEEIDSTNEEARRRAEAGEPGPIWLRADVQSAGRGRRGREWVSKTGNLFATLLIRPKMKPGEAALLSFAAALAVADLMDAFVDPERVRLKWPNDVELDGKKVSGILLESSAQTRGNVEWLAVGIGINLTTHPGLEKPRTIALGEVTNAPTPKEALNHLAAAFTKWHSEFENKGFEVLQAAWLARARGLIEPITVRLPKETLQGQFVGIDETGALLLETESGLWKVSAGEVFFG